MSKSNIVWKIRDPETGLFWCGFDSGCSHKIGTRFATRSSLDSSLTRAINSGQFKPHWEVIKAELEEKVLDVRGYDFVKIDHMLTSDKLTVRLGNALDTDRRDIADLLSLIRNLRREDQLWNYEVIGLRKNREHWTKWFDNMKNLSVPKDKVKRAPDGFVLFVDEKAAIAAKMSDTMKFIFNVNTLCIRISEILGIELSDI